MSGRLYTSYCALGVFLMSGYLTPVVYAQFTDIGAGLIGLEDGDTAWGDYDNDGDLDVLLTGCKSSAIDTQGNRDCVSDGFSTQLYRNVNGTFSPISTALTNASDGSGVWGDYDNDGDLDVVLTGRGTGFGLVGRIFRNNSGSFVNISTGLTGLRFGAAAWGDYDNDGDLDVIFSGRDTGEPRRTFLYRNDGPTTFTQAGFDFPDVDLSAFDWGDYDNDGDLDLLLVGNEYHAQRLISRIYRNNGAGSFTFIDYGLIGLEWASAAWGDYDNDGDLDIALNGGDGMGGVFARIYRNNAGASFTDVGAGLPGTEKGEVAWGDYDNDGDLDLLVSGLDGASGALTRIYTNDGGSFSEAHDLGAIGSSAAAWGDYDGDGDLDVLVSGELGAGRTTRIYRNDVAVTANSRPSSPGGLSHTVTDKDVTLRWNVSTDAETPGAGLGYNLRVGTSPGAFDVIAPMSDGAGNRRLPWRGNADQGRSWRLEGLPAGTYYWSVQSIDHGFLASPFATENTFEIEDANPTATPIPGVSVFEDAPTASINLNVYFEDPEDGDNLQYSIESNTNSALVTPVLSGSTLELRFVANQNGTSLVDVRATDTADNFVTARVTATVTSVNDAPQFVIGGDQSVFEDAGAQSVANWATGVSAGPNEGAQSLTFVVNTDNNSLFLTPPAVSSSGTLTYQPAANASGSTTVSVFLRDDGATTNGGVNQSPVRSFTITVNAVNDEPTFTAGGNVVVDEDAGLITNDQWASNISAGPLESGQNLNFSVVSDNTALFTLQPTINQDGDLVFETATDANGSATVTATLKDDSGIANGGDDTSGPRVFSITLRPVNDPPNFTRGPDQVVQQDAGPQRIEGWATDIRAGPVNEAGQSLFFEISVDDATLFEEQPSLVISGSAALLSYTPVTSDTGTAQVRLVLKDNGGTAFGGKDSSTVQVLNISIGVSNTPAMPAEISIAPTPAHLDTVPIQTTVTDFEGDLATVVIRWTLNTIEQLDIPMQQGTGNQFSGVIPGQPGGSAVTFTVVTTDQEGLSGSTQIPVSYTVRPSQPTFEPSVVEPGRFILRWEPAIGAETYRIFRDTRTPPTQLLQAGITGTIYTDDAIAEDSVYYYIVLGVNDGGGGPGSDPISLSSCVPPAPQASLQPGPERIVLRWEPPSDCDIGEMLVIKNGVEVARPDPAAGLYVDNDVSSGGVFTYRLGAVTEAGNAGPTTTLGPISPFAYPATQTIETEARAFGDHTLSTNYRLIGLPGGVDILVASTFTGEPGIDWNVFFDNGNAGDQPDDYLIPFSNAQPDIFTFGEGRGFWAIQNSPWQVSENVATVPLSLENTYAIPLHPGWNIITNPFLEPVAWPEIAALNSVLDTLWQFDGNFTSANELRAFEGYYLINEREPVLTELLIPFHGAGITAGRNSSHSPSASGPKEPRIQPMTLRIRDAAGYEASTYIGRHSEAVNGLDRHDQFAPPSDFAALSIRLFNPELTSEYKWLAAEYRSDAGEGQVYEVFIETSTPGTLDVEAAGLDLFADRQVLLVDARTSSAYDLHRQSTFQIPARGASDPYFLFIGSDDFVAERRADIVPEVFELAPNYPNPFHTETHIEYALPAHVDGYAVRLEIYNMLGQRVAILVEQHQLPGRYVVRWHGRDLQQHPLASGIYLMRLQAGTHQQVRTMVLLR